MSGNDAGSGGEDEVEIEPDNEEYEVLPLSPIRKLEKRIDELEEQKQVGDAKGFMREIMDLVKANQRMVEEIVRSNNELTNELEKIPGKINEVTGQWKEFLDILKRGGEGGVSTGASEDLGKLVELNKSLIDKNEEMVKSMKDLQKSIKSSRTPKVRVKSNRSEEREGRRPEGRRSSRRERESPRARLKKKREGE